MRPTNNIMMDVYFPTVDKRNQFAELIEAKTDWSYTVHGDRDVPNSLYIKLYSLDLTDLSYLQAVLFTLSVDNYSEHINIPLLKKRT